MADLTKVPETALKQLVYNHSTSASVVVHVQRDDGIHKRTASFTRRRKGIREGVEQLSCHQCKVKKSASEFIQCHTQKQLQSFGHTLNVRGTIYDTKRKMTNEHGRKIKAKPIKHPCVKNYCRTCLEKHYDIQFELTQSEKLAFICPACREHCTCAHCAKQARGSIAPLVRLLLAAQSQSHPPYLAYINGTSIPDIQKDDTESDASDGEEEESSTSPIISHDQSNMISQSPISSPSSSRPLRNPPSSSQSTLHGPIISHPSQSTSHAISSHPSTSHIPHPFHHTLALLQSIQHASQLSQSQPQQHHYYTYPSGNGINISSSSSSSSTSSSSSSSIRSHQPSNSSHIQPQTPNSSHIPSHIPHSPHHSSQSSILSSPPSQLQPSISSHPSSSSSSSIDTISPDTLIQSMITSMPTISDFHNTSMAQAKLSTLQQNMLILQEILAKKHGITLHGITSSPVHAITSSSSHGHAITSTPSPHLRAITSTSPSTMSGSPLSIATTSTIPSYELPASAQSYGTYTSSQQQSQLQQPSQQQVSNFSYDYSSPSSFVSPVARVTRESTSTSTSTSQPSLQQRQSASTSTSTSQPSLQQRRARTRLAINTKLEPSSPSKKRSATMAALQQPPTYILTEPQTARPHTYHDIPIESHSAHSYMEDTDTPEPTSGKHKKRKKIKRESKVIFEDDLEKIRDIWKQNGYFELHSPHMISEPQTARPANVKKSKTKNRKMAGKTMKKEGKKRATSTSTSKKHISSSPVNTNVSSPHVTIPILSYPTSKSNDSSSSIITPIATRMSPSDVDDPMLPSTFPSTSPFNSPHQKPRKLSISSIPSYISRTSPSTSPFTNLRRLPSSSTSALPSLCNTPTSISHTLTLNTTTTSTSSSIYNPSPTNIQSFFASPMIHIRDIHDKKLEHDTLPSLPVTPSFVTPNTPAIQTPSTMMRTIFENPH